MVDESTKLFLSKPFQLGDWLVEPDLNRLSRGTEALNVEPKTLEVLVYLCERHGQVVSANEIIDAVWHGRPMGDNPVYKSIAKLRSALGDDSGDPRYIATVPKKGYLLVAEIAAPTTTTKPRRRTGPVKRLLNRTMPISAGILIGLTIAAAVFWKSPSEPAKLVSLSDFSGSHSQPSLSPDGSSIAFVNEVDGRANIWVLNLEETMPRQLTDGETTDSRPRWSPTGESILFARDGGLWSVSATGGAAREIIRDAYNPNWSFDGRRIVFERRYEVWTADADGSRQQRVDGVPRRELALAARWPAFSPDGQYLVFLDAEATPMADLWRVPLDGGSPEQLTFQPAFSSAPAWSPDGKHIVYSSLRGGSRTLWSVRVADKSSRALLTGSGDDDYPDISADGRRMVYSNSRERYSLLESNPHEDSERVLHESRQMLLGPELSPDQETVAYFSPSRTGGMQLFTIPVSGSVPRQVTSDPLATHAIPRWSSDGSTLYFYYTGDEKGFGRVPVSGGDADLLVRDWDWISANGASVSPDGSRICYSRLTGQVPVQTLLRNLDGSGVSSFYATLEYPRWSANGRYIYGARHSDLRFPGDIAICPVEGPECRIIATSSRVPQLSPDESKIYFVRGFGRSQELFVRNASGSGREHHLMTMAPLSPINPFYDVTDSGSIIWVRHEVEAAEIWLTTLAYE